MFSVQCESVNVTERMREDEERGRKGMSGKRKRKGANRRKMRCSSSEGTKKGREKGRGSSGEEGKRNWVSVVTWTHNVPMHADDGKGKRCVSTDV